MSDTIQDGRDRPIFIHSDLDDLGLDPYAFRIYARLARRAGSDGAFESVPSMAEGCQMSERKVRDSLKELISRQMLTYKQRSGKPTVYRLTPRREWRDPLQIRQGSDSTGVGSDRGPLADQTDEGTPPKGIQEKSVTDARAKRSGIDPDKLCGDDPTASHPAVLAWIEAFGVAPTPYFRKRIIHYVGDTEPALTVWRDRCEAWAASATEEGRSYNPGNVPRIIQLFKDDLADYEQAEAAGATGRGPVQSSASGAHPRRPQGGVQGGKAASTGSSLADKAGRTPLEYLHDNGWTDEQIAEIYGAGEPEDTARILPLRRTGSDG